MRSSSYTQLHKSNHAVHFETHQRLQKSKSPKKKDEYIQYLEKQISSITNNNPNYKDLEKRIYQLENQKELEGEPDMFKVVQQMQQTIEELQLAKQQLREEFNMKIQVLMQEKHQSAVSEYQVEFQNKVLKDIEDLKEQVGKQKNKKVQQEMQNIYKQVDNVLKLLDSYVLKEQFIGFQKKVKQKLSQTIDKFSNLFQQQVNKSVAQSQNKSNLSKSKSKTLSKSKSKTTLSNVQEDKTKLIGSTSYIRENKHKSNDITDERRNNQNLHKNQITTQRSLEKKKRVSPYNIQNEKNINNLFKQKIKQQKQKAKRK